MAYAETRPEVGATVPGLWVESVSTPIDSVTGEPLEMDGLAFIKVSVTGTTWDPEAPQAVPPVLQTDEPQLVTDVAYQVESGGSSVLYVGVATRDVQFRLSSTQDPVQIVLEIRSDAGPT